MNRARPLVLLVEDDADTAALYQAMLMPLELEVVYCRNCKSTRAWLGEAGGRPDLVVMDARLPDGNGLELCGEINAAGSSPPILLLSAHGDPRMPSLCRAAGVHTFLDKLRDLDRLVGTVEQLLSIDATGAE